MAFCAVMCETCIVFTSNSRPPKTEVFGDPEATPVNSWKLSDAPSKVDGSDANRHQENETPRVN